MRELLESRRTAIQHHIGPDAGRPVASRSPPRYALRRGLTRALGAISRRRIIAVATIVLLAIGFGFAFLALRNGKSLADLEPAHDAHAQAVDALAATNTAYLGSKQEQAAEVAIGKRTLRLVRSHGLYSARRRDTGASDGVWRSAAPALTVSPARRTRSAWMAEPPPDRLSRSQILRSHRQQPDHSVHGKRPFRPRTA